MIFRSWITLENVDFTEFLSGNFDNYVAQIKQSKSVDVFFYHILLADYYTQIADFKSAQYHLHSVTFEEKNEVQQAEFALSEIFYQNRVGEIHQAVHTFEHHKKYAKNHPDTEFWMYYQLMGSNVYFRKGKVEKAFKMAKKLLKKITHFPILNLLTHIALSEYVLYLGELKQAEDFFIEAQHIFETQNTDYQLFLPIFERHQCLLSRSRFDTLQAHKYLENALKLTLNLYGKQHGDVASAYCEKAVLALQEGNYQAMHQYNLTSEQIRKHLYPDNRAELAQNTAFRAIYVRTQGNSAEAVSLYDEAYLMLKKATWVRNPNLLGLQFSQAVFEAELGETEQSLKKMTQILSETRKVRGKNFTELAPAHVFMAEAQMAMGEYLEAQKCLLEAFRICDETIGEQNIVYADCLKTCGRVYVLEGKNAMAERAFTQALHLLSSLNQRNTLRFTMILQALSDLYQEVGEMQKSILYLEKCIRILEELPHTSNLQMLELYLQLCEAYIEQKSSKAEVYLEQLTQFGQDLPNDHPAHISILKTAIHAKLNQKKYSEALHHAQAISQLLTLKNELDNPIYQETELQICDLLLQTRQFQKCIERARKLLAQREGKGFQHQVTLKLIKALRLHGDVEEAENVCRIYLNRNAQFRDLTDYYTELALIYSETKRYILSKKYFEEAIANLTRIAGVDSYRHLAVWELYQKLSTTMKDKQLETYISDKLIEIRAHHVN